MYVDNARLEQLIAARAAGEVSGEAELVEMIRIIASSVARTFGGKDIDETIQEAMVHCWRAIDVFVPGRGKAFNFLTTVCRNAGRRTWKSDRVYRRALEDYGLSRREYSTG
jgi:DNA-directed RNA polymerase specialized sigma24 family protein